MKIVRDGLTREGWQAAAMPLQQSWAYGEVLSRLGATVGRVGLVTPSGARGVAQVTRRRIGPVRFSLLSRGPVWDGAAPTAGEEAAALRALGRAFRPLLATPERDGPGLALVTPRHRAHLDLTADPATLRARFDGKWRNRLTRAEGEGLCLRVGRPDPAAVAWLLHQDAALQRARGYRALPAPFTRAWLAFDPAAAVVAEARIGGRRVAAMLFLLHAPWASYHVGWSGEAGRRSNAHALLLWQAMLRLREEGCTVLDLGDVDTERAPGLARFKIGTGAPVARLGATVLLPPW
jgi:hypothetical protein